MALPLVESFNVAGAYGTVDDCKIAGDFLWVLTVTGNALIRLRPSDGAFLTAAGAVTNLAGATVGLTGAAPKSFEVMDGHLFVQSGDGYIRTYDAVTGVYQDAIVHSANGSGMCVHDGLVWASEVAEINGYDATGEQATIPVTNAPTALVPGAAGTIYFVSTAAASQVVGVVDTVGLSELTGIDIGTNAAAPLHALCFDGTYLWAAAFNSESIWRVRASDGAVIMPDGSTGVLAAGDSLLPLRQASPNPITGGCLGYFDGRVWMSGYGASDLVCVNPTTQRTLAHFFAPNDNITDTVNPYWSYFASWRLYYDGQYLWVPNIAADPVGGFLYRLEITPVSASVNLTAVDPGTGPHLTLTFNNPVGAATPTIGSPSSGVGVTSVTQVSAAVVDLNLAIRPDHPSGDATSANITPPIGEADPLGPPVPTGVGATTT